MGRGLTTPVLVAVLALAGCPGATINNATPDADPPDAMITDPNYLGQACDATLNPCPAGWECLDQAGGNGAFCTKACVDQADPVCDLNYTGPGYGACILAPDGVTGLRCAVVCQDPAGPPEICPPGTTCNGTCLGTLQCTGEIVDQNQTVVGYSCQ